MPIPPGTWCPVFPDRTEENRAALSHQQDLESNLSALLNDIKSGRQSQAALEKAIIAAQKHAAGLKMFLSSCIPQKFYNERRSDSSTAAQRTFDVAELLEMILDHLEIPDIVKMIQVSHSLKNSIEASTKLQDKLSLRPAPLDSHIYSAFEQCLFREGGFRCTLTNYNNTRPQALPGTFAVRAYFFPFPGQHLPKIGSKYRRMFICQPPIKQMKVYLSCCPRDRELGFLPQLEVCTVSSDGGLTIGHLYDCARKQMDEHRWCPYASTFSLDDDGVVMTGVQFKGSVVLQPDHPILRDRAASMEAARAQNEQYSVKEAKLRAYGAAKIQGKCSSREICSCPFIVC